jgi:hypothetical protein
MKCGRFVERAIKDLEHRGGTQVNEPFCHSHGETEEKYERRHDNK